MNGIARELLNSVGAEFETPAARRRFAARAWARRVRKAIPRRHTAPTVSHRSDVLLYATVAGVENVVVQHLVFTNEYYCVTTGVGGRRFHPEADVSDVRPITLIDPWNEAS